VDSARRGEPLIASGSDDCSIKIWDRRKRTPVNSVNNTYQVTAVSFSEAGDQVISGGIDNLVKIWDLRNSSTPAHVCKGHTDTITRYRTVVLLIDLIMIC
jgi:Prp8 binding protein